MRYTSSTTLSNGPTASERYAATLETIGKEYAPILRISRDEGPFRDGYTGTNDRVTWATNGYSLWWQGDTSALPDKMRTVIPPETYHEAIIFECTPELTRTLAALVKSERWDVNRRAIAVIGFGMGDKAQLTYIMRYSWSADTLQPPVDTALPGTFPHCIRLDARFLLDALKYLATERKGKPFAVRLTCGSTPKIGDSNVVLSLISIEGYDGTEQLNRHVVQMPMRCD